MIETEVNVWMDGSRMFTAFEISRALKAKGIGLRHRDMKRQIHSAISARRSRTYTRTLMDVGAPEQAWVYHPMTKNPYQFQALARNDGPAVGGNSVVKTNVPNAPNPNPNPNPAKPFKPRNQVALADNDKPQANSADGAYGCDGNGHLKLPAKELLKIGVAGDQELMIYGNLAAQKVVLGLSEHIDDDSAEPVRTLDNGNLIIDHEVLEFVDLDWLACYKVEVNGQLLEISEFH